MKFICSATILLCLNACVSSQLPASSIAGNPTPELINESQRSTDIIRNEVVMDNINERMLNGDIRRFWLRDHPSRLSPFPITYTSGMPR